MKKASLLLAFVVLGTTVLTAQDRDQDRIHDPKQDRLMLVDGDVLQIKDRDQTQLQDPLTLTDGTIINPDGSYLTKDKDQLRLKDGEFLDNNGKKFGSEYQYRSGLKKENKGLTSAQIQERNQNRYQVMLINGDAYRINTQSQDRLQQQLQLGGGVALNPDGSYTRNRKKLQLKDGECLNMDGSMLKNTYLQRKMITQKNSKANKGMMKSRGQKMPKSLKNKKGNN